MLKQLVETVRKYPLLKYLLCFHAVAIAALTALYYMRADTMLRGSVLSIRVVRDADGKWLYQHFAGGPFLMLPWKLLPQHVLWLALDLLVFGSLTICVVYRFTGNALRRQAAGREKAAADKLLEAEGESAAAERRMREAEAWEQRLRVRESQLEARESETANRELEAQAHVREKDAEVTKMSVALTRLKGEVSELRKRLRA